MCSEEEVVQLFAENGLLSKASVSAWHILSSCLFILKLFYSEKRSLLHFVKSYFILFCSQLLANFSFCVLSDMEDDAAASKLSKQLSEG